MFTLLSRNSTKDLKIYIDGLYIYRYTGIVIDIFHDIIVLNVPGVLKTNNFTSALCLRTPYKYINTTVLQVSYKIFLH